MKTIELVISANGETKLETKGFSGSSCREASEFIEQALGERKSERLTSEFYQPVSTQALQQQRARS